MLAVFRKGMSDDWFGKSAGGGEELPPYFALQLCLLIQLSPGFVGFNQLTNRSGENRYFIAKNILMIFKCHELISVRCLKLS